MRCACLYAGAECGCGQACTRSQGQAHTRRDGHLAAVPVSLLPSGDQQRLQMPLPGSFEPEGSSSCAPVSWSTWRLLMQGAQAAGKDSLSALSASSLPRACHCRAQRTRLRCRPLLCPVPLTLVGNSGSPPAHLRCRPGGASVP